MNLLLAIVIFATVFAINGVPTPTDKQLIGEVYPNSPAAAAGFKAGDVLVTLNGQPVADRDSISTIANASANQPIPAAIERDGKAETLTVTPGPWTTPQGEQRKAGLGISYGPKVINTPTNPINAVWLGVKSSFDALGQMLGYFGDLIGGLFQGQQSQVQGGLAGPIGIARVTGEVINQGGMPAFWRLMALLSLNLFLLNLLPIPALDGSHIMFSLIEWVRGGKKVPPEKEALVHAIGFAALMALMLVVSISDILNAINGRSVLGG